MLAASTQILGESECDVQLALMPSLLRTTCVSGVCCCMIHATLNLNRLQLKKNHRRMRSRALEAVHQMKKTVGLTIRRSPKGNNVNEPKGQKRGQKRMWQARRERSMQTCHQCQTTLHFPSCRQLLGLDLQQHPSWVQRQRDSHQNDRVRRMLLLQQPTGHW